MPKYDNPAVPGSHTFIDPTISNEENRKIAQDPATHLAVKRGQFLEIFHIPSGESIVFKAYIEDFQDKYDSEWSDTQVYGRMDPIRQFKGTKRVISLDWAVPSYTIAEARFNHKKCALLFSMLYPNYDVVPEASSATQISTAPVFKVKFGNLIQDPSVGEEGGTVEDSGLVGAISGFTYTPNFDMGFHDDIDRPGVLYPKESKLSMEYTVFHTHALGWDGVEKREKGFPYGVSNIDAEFEAQDLRDDMIEVIESAIGGIFD